MTKRITINEIKQLLQLETFMPSQLEEWQKDERAGVKKAIEQYKNKLAKRKQKYEVFEKMWQFDQQYVEANKYLAGVDEAGRGPLAGPLVIGAVILPNDHQLIGLTDSKQLTELERNTFFTAIKEQAISYHIEIIDPNTIDRLNILQATKEGMRKSLQQLDIKPDVALIDAETIGDLPYPTHSIVKGDDKSITIAAASVLAKVTRDRLMEEYDQQYPVYNFKQNKGYGTKDHVNAMKQYGITPLHRRSFKPVQAYITK